MGLFDNDAVYFVESGRRARKLAAGVSDLAGGIVTVRNTSRGDGVWALDVIGDPDKAWVGRAYELDGPTAEVKNGNLSRAFPYMVDGGRGRAVVLLEDIADVPRMLRAAGADMRLVLTLALEALVHANARLEIHEAAESRRDAAAWAKRNAGN